MKKEQLLKQVFTKSFYLIFCFTLTAALSFAQELRISGKVTDKADGGPMPGVSVLIKNSAVGAVTNR